MTTSTAPALDLRITPDDIARDLEAGRSRPLVPAHERTDLLVRTDDRPKLGGPAFRATWSAVQALGRIDSRIDSRIAWPALDALWFTPWTVGRERELPLGARRRTFRTGGTALEGWEVGRGPTVLLVHGWGGRSTDLVGVADALAAAGFRAVAADLPAHGRSPGRRTNLVELGHAVRALGHHLEATDGPLHGAVTHSLGGAATVLALRDGLHLPRLALLAPPRRLERAVSTFVAQAGLSPALHQALRALLEQRFGAGVWEDLAVDGIAGTLRTDALVVHDAQDAQIPVEDARVVATALRGKFVETEGLGHSRILIDRDVLRRVVRHLQRGR